jgi:hypothetical protein
MAQGLTRVSSAPTIGPNAFFLFTQAEAWLKPGLSFLGPSGRTTALKHLRKGNDMPHWQNSDQR